MTCVHLKELYDVCVKHDLKLTGGDLIRIVCPQCGVVDTCPSAHIDPLADRESPEPRPPAKGAEPR